MGLFEEYYDEHNLDENSQYSDMSRKELVIEVEHLHNSLWNILKYVDNGGTDIDVVKAEVYDGIYESRIWCLKLAIQDTTYKLCPVFLCLIIKGITKRHNLAP